MDKKTLIGVSICAVVLLVLGSLSNVVGYQSVKSTVNDSPLFQTRTRRATNQQQNTLTSQYLGMGKGNLLQFPTRDNKTESLKKAIELISKMDDKTFERFTELCIQRAKQDKILSDTNSNEIVQTLYMLRTKQEAIKNSLFSRDNYSKASTSFGWRVTLCFWLPGCLIFEYSVFILNMILVLILFLWPTSAYNSCHGPSYCVVPCASLLNGQSVSDSN
jgi:hypothetical protein